MFQPRGRFVEVARARTRGLRNSLTPWGDQTVMYHVYPTAAIPRVDPVCWSKKGEWQVKKCGTLVWPPAGIATAQR